MDRIIFFLLIGFQWVLYKLTGKTLDWVNHKHSPNCVRSECYQSIQNNVNTLFNSLHICLITFITLIIYYPWDSLLLSFFPTKQQCNQQFEFPIDYRRNQDSINMHTESTKLNIWHLSFLYQSSFYIFDIIFEYLEYRKFIKLFKRYQNEHNRNKNNISKRLSHSQIYHLHTRKNEKKKYLQLMIAWRILLLFQIFLNYYFNLLNNIFYLYIIIGLPEFSNLILLIGKLLFFLSKQQNTNYIINTMNISIVIGIFTMVKYN